MGVKRFLVAGGMASLVLIGILLIVDAKAIASIAQASAKGKNQGITIGGQQIQPVQKAKQYGTTVKNKAEDYCPGGLGCPSGGPSGGPSASRWK